ncbi:BON domain-containing protein [Paucibacter sp. KCTC 42545]|uniref:BON domain-containing protein n=1 Tax=Paucibacter sp. KCTC 42545 TaxID=1768242 RepID=UPI000733AD6B|nr:BON domain-containing protein [Paucibacter sp. KCTC 42545]ALT76422.1 hypothetical protein AT984_03560 [Paucibacter sp. KCTC 42545]
MKIPKNPSPQAMRALAAAIIALSMAACSKEADDARTPGKKLDDGIAKMEQQSEAMKPEVKQGAADAASASSTAMQDAKQATLEMREQVGADLSDAGIVTTVKAKLAAETLLTVSDINVDSTKGRVVLRGTAADKVAVARARAIALGVKGVVDVDNQLTVKTKS